MDEERVDLVDKKGNIIGEATREEVCQKGLLHPAVNIIIVNSQRKIYIQQRSSMRSTFPLYWDVSAAEHVKKGETFKSAATRGLFEELLITAPLRLLRERHVQKSRYWQGNELIKEYELVELYGGVFDGKITINDEEVAFGKFVSFDELRKFNKKNFTPWGLDEVLYLAQNPQIIDVLMNTK